MKALPEADGVELVLFEVGDRVYGADATQVLRVERRRPEARDVVALGALTQGARALVCRTEAGERQLPIDAVRGVRRARPADLRRRPPTAHASPYAIGFWLDGDTPVVLIDLLQATSSP